MAKVLVFTETTSDSVKSVTLEKKSPIKIQLQVCGANLNKVKVKTKSGVS